MAEIINLRKRIAERPARRNEPDFFGSAEILLFDGVRYETIQADKADISKAKATNSVTGIPQTRVNR
ncbi:MAG: hypothetical protein AAFY99_11220 [Pseudomonadota bacterium]